ncbi:MAG: glycosyltransferase family protein [Planctomycetota bacterium]
MARIFYSMAGEGRGHATRVRTVTDHLRERHELTLLAPGDAYELLEKAYRASDVRVQRIPGLRFAYDRKQKVSQLGTAALVARYALALPQIDRELAELMRHHRADLLLTDYDPGGPRAAKRAGVPYVALDHQSFFNFSDLSWLPKKLQHRGAFVARINRFLYHGQRHTISSSFDPIRSRAWRTA